MKFLFYVVMALLAGALVTSVAMNAPGYVMVGFGETSIELPLVDFILGILVFMLLVFVVSWLAKRVLTAPGVLGNMRTRHQRKASRRGMMQGLVEMAAGEWGKAEKTVLTHVECSEAPVLNYLAAAHAAQRLGIPDRRDSYLRKAIAADPKAEMAVTLTQADLQIRQEQYELALATLRRAEQISPQHKFVKKQLARLFFRLKDWQSLTEQLPYVRKSGVLKPQELHEMELASALARLRQAVPVDSEPSAAAVWASLPAEVKAETQVVARYVEVLQLQEKDHEAEKVLLVALEGALAPQLLHLFAGLKLEDPLKSLGVLEKWLAAPGNRENPDLLTAAGRVSIKARLWGKARDLLERGLKVNACPDAYQALGRLHEETGDVQAAAAAYRAGLALCCSAV